MNNRHIFKTLLSSRLLPSCVFHGAIQRW